MGFDFDSSTPLSIRNMNINRPLRPLTRKQDPESFLRPSSSRATSTNRAPLKSILKNKNDVLTREPLKQLPSNYRVPSIPKFDFFKPLKDMGSKVFQKSSPPVRTNSLPTRKPYSPPPVARNIPETRKVSDIKPIDAYTQEIEFLKKKVTMLEEQSLDLLRTNRDTLLKKEMEKQDLEIQNQLLRRELENAKRNVGVRSGNDSDILASYDSKVRNMDIDGAQNLRKVQDIYKSEPLLGEHLVNDSEMDEIRRKIEFRRQRHLDQDSNSENAVLRNKIANLELKMQRIASSTVSNQAPVSSDEKLLKKIEKIEEMLTESRKRTRDAPDGAHQRKRSKLYELDEWQGSDQLSPVRL